MASFLILFLIGLITTLSVARTTQNIGLDKRSTSVVLPLRRPISAREKPIRRRQNTATIQSIDQENYLLTDVTLGTQTIPLLVDTGSSDTWVVSNTFSCFDKNTGKAAGASACRFGSVQFADDPSLEVVEDVHLNLSYGSGEWLNGRMVYNQVSFAGVKVPKQEMAVVTSGAWVSDTSGVLGLAFPGLTSAFVGNSAINDDTNAYAHYPPVLETIFDTNLVSPHQMTLAISRDASQKGNGGYLALGDPASLLSDPNVAADTTTTATVPLEVTYKFSYYAFYSITVDQVIYTGTDTSHHQYSLDCGSQYLFLHDYDATHLAPLYDPPATADGSGFYTVPCNATPPKLSFRFGKVTININAADMIVTDTQLPTGTCISAVQSENYAGRPILGDTFFRNVVAIHDWSKMQMQLIQRGNYPS